jgi:hypothetical protein
MFFLMLTMKIHNFAQHLYHIGLLMETELSCCEIGEEYLCTICIYFMLQSVNLPSSKKYRIFMVGRHAMLTLKPLLLLLIMG